MPVANAPVGAVARRSSPTPRSGGDALLGGPIVPTMLRLALPTIAVQLAQTAVGVAETYFVSDLGTDTNLRSID